MSVFRIYRKEEHLDRAKKLLNSDSTIDHVYACLELRFCIEAIVYQKLLHGIKNIPNSIIDTWQPHKAMGMLVDIDELTTSDCKIEINLNKSDVPPEDGWLPFGEQRIPPVKWLSKNYNKLGNFLHLVEPKKALINSSILKDEISPMVEALEEYVKVDLVVSINNIEISRCPICKYEFAFSVDKVKHGDSRRCNNFKCDAIFVANKTEGLDKITFTCKTFDINCLNCGELMVIPEHKVRSLEDFICNNCESKYLIKGNYKFTLHPAK